MGEGVSKRDREHIDSVAAVCVSKQACGGKQRSKAGEEILRNANDAVVSLFEQPRIHGVPLRVLLPLEVGLRVASDAVRYLLVPNGPLVSKCSATHEP